MVNPFDILSVSEDEAAEVLKDVEANPRGRDSGICICGHPRSKHVSTHIGTVCSPAKHYCPCKKVRVVLEAPNLRLFLYKTTGADASHALVKGISRSVELGLETNWVGGSVCDHCQKERKVSVVPVSQRGVEMSEPTGYDVLLCNECRFGLTTTESEGV
jgi:hypothetical protein